MQKIVILNVLLLAMVGTMQASLSCPLDSVIERNQDGDFVNKVVYRYDEGGRTIEEASFIWKDSLWFPDTKMVCQYTPVGNSVQLSFKETWKGDSLLWVGVSKNVYTYTTAGKKNRDETYCWNNGWVPKNATDYFWTDATASSKDAGSIYYTGLDSTWVPSWKKEYAYYGTTTNKTKDCYWTVYDQVTSTWKGGKSSYRKNYSYETINNKVKSTLTEEYTWDVNSQDWKGSKKTETTYNSTGSVATLTTTYTWNTSSKLFYASKKVYKIVDEQNRIVDSYTTTNNGSGVWIGSGTRTRTTYIGTSSQTDSVITYSWDTSNAQWLSKKLVIKTYEQKKVAVETTFVYTEGAWVPSSKTENVNYSGSTVSEYYTYKWENDNWTYVKHYQTTDFGSRTMTWQTDSTWEQTAGDSATSQYKESKLVYRDTYYWNTSKRVWIGKTKDLYQYDGDNQIYTASYKFVEGTTNDWVPEFQVTSSYDNQDRMLISERLDYSSGTWIGHYRYEHLYNDNGKEILTASLNGWNTGTGTWASGTKTESEWNTANKETNKVTYTWSQGAWLPSFRYTFNYTPAGKESGQIVEQYVGGAWKNTSKYVKEYNASGVLIANNTYIWQNETWEFSSRSELSYDEDSSAKLRVELAAKWNNSQELTSYSQKHYHYACDPTSFLITFKNWNDTILETQDVFVHTTPVYAGATPTKEGMPEYIYTFIGWSPVVEPAMGEQEYIAMFDSIERPSYKITFMNIDEDELLIDSVPQGIVPQYTGEVPYIPSTWQYTFVFAGWTPELAPVTQDQVYTAVYDSILNQYAVTFLDKDSTTILKVDSVPYGAAAVAPVAPTYPNYTFDRWSEDFSEVLRDMAVYAIYRFDPLTALPEPEVDVVMQPTKRLQDGVMMILVDDRIYTILGQKKE